MRHAVTLRVSHIFLFGLRLLLLQLFCRRLRFSCTSGMHIFTVRMCYVCCVVPTIRFDLSIFFFLSRAILKLKLVVIRVSLFSFFVQALQKIFMEYL